MRGFLRGTRLARPAQHLGDNAADHLEPVLPEVGSFGFASAGVREFRGVGRITEQAFRLSAKVAKVTAAVRGHRTSEVRADRGAIVGEGRGARGHGQQDAFAVA